MSEIKLDDYSVLENAGYTTGGLIKKIKSSRKDIVSYRNTLENDAVFCGPIKDNCLDEIDIIKSNLKNKEENFGQIKVYLNNSLEQYKSADSKADIALINETPSVSSLALKDEITLKKDINISEVKDGTNVANALNKYSDELKNAEYATVKENIYTTTTTEYINGKEVKVTHVVINNPNQINGEPANGAYASGKETASSAAKRVNSVILVNGSHFTDSGAEDLKGANHIVIVDGQVMTNGYSGGNEMLLDKNGNIYNAYGKTADELVNNGVKYSFACHSTQVIENGDITPSTREQRNYIRTVIGQAGNCEYYIITDQTDQNRLSDTAQYLRNKGVINAYSLDQGGSVTLVRNDQVINNLYNGSERYVGDFLYITN